MEDQVFQNIFLILRALFVLRPCRLCICLIYSLVHWSDISKLTLKWPWLCLLLIKLVTLHVLVRSFRLQRAGAGAGAGACLWFDVCLVYGGQRSGKCQSASRGRKCDHAKPTLKRKASRSERLIDQTHSFKWFTLHANTAVSLVQRYRVDQWLTLVSNGQGLT